MKDIHQILSEHFGHTAFRPQQEAIINAVLQGKDVLALLPTGGGKSLCYQVPALAMEGMCLVVSPLIALIKDQVDHLRRKGITAFSLHSGMSYHEVRSTIQTAIDSKCKFLYVSPERLQTRLFKERLLSLEVGLIAVDEAHCISQWGYDFRPPYLRIADLREELPDVPIIALTASATTAVQQDICEKLLFKEQLIIRSSFAKPNVSFSAFRLSTKYNKLRDVLHHVPGSALVYCRNRKRTKEIALLLQQDGIAASYYHAGLTTAERTQRQQDWIENRIRVMVCTNAFGMGIDKPDVRTVVHMDVPECVENYYQEAGRAGRDGKRAYAVLLFNDTELKDMERLPAQKFPVIFDIRRVYQSLCNYLQLPEGSGREQYFDVDIREFCERWKLDVNMVASVLKTLEQAGYVSFMETVFVSSKAGFTTSKATLYEFERQQPRLEPMIKHLLRNYEGIFDNLVGIFEQRIAKALQVEVAEAQAQLRSLAFHNIIEYHPQKDTPQVYFLYDRVPKEQLSIDHKAYEKRKAQYADRIRSMIGYAENTQRCRGEVLRQYFGEQETSPCGICDVCLQQKQQQLSMSDEQWRSVIERMNTLLTEPRSLDELAVHFRELKRQQLAHVIDRMLAEELVVYDVNGKLRRS